MSASYTISSLAYRKIVLHAAKYPTSIVNGVLLGSASGLTVTITDAVPLLHHWTSLSPSMEIGLQLAEFHASSKSLSIVGYYQGNERLGDTSLSITGTNVANQIKARFPQAVVLIIDNDSLATGENALIPHLPSSSTSWSPSSSKLTLESSSTPSDALRAVREDRLFERFGDFDDHLEDVSVDWLNNAAVVRS